MEATERSRIAWHNRHLEPPDDAVLEYADCPDCDGAGRIYEEGDCGILSRRCGRCRGRGRVVVAKDENAAPAL